MFVWIIFVVILTSTSCDQVAKVTKNEAKNAIVIEELGVLWHGVKQAYLRFNLDFDSLYKMSKKLKLDIKDAKLTTEMGDRGIEITEKELKNLDDQIDIAKHFEKKFDSMDDNDHRGSKLRGDEIILDVYKYEDDRADKLTDPLFPIMKKAIDAAKALEDFAVVLVDYIEWDKLPKFSKYDSKRFQVFEAVEQFEEKFQDYKFINQRGFSLTKKSAGKYEMIQELTFIKVEDKLKVFKILDNKA